MSLYRTALILALIASPCGAQPIAGEEVIEPNPKQLAQLRALTPEGVEGQISIKTDSLEPLITVTSEKVWKSNGKFTDKVRSDNFLRAFIDKRTGAVRYQLYQEVIYTGEWRRFDSVNYETSNGPGSAQITPISQEVIGCSFGLCAYRPTNGALHALRLLPICQSSARRRHGLHQRTGTASSRATAIGKGSGSTICRACPITNPPGRRNGSAPRLRHRRPDTAARSSSR